MSPDALRALALQLLAEELTARRYTAAARSMVLRSGRDFLAWLCRHQHPDLAGCTALVLLEFQAWLSRRTSRRTGRPLAPSTVNARLGAVELLFACLYRQGALAHNPVHGLEWRLPLPSGWKRRPLSRDEITRFLEAIDTRNLRGLRDRTLFELIYSSGLRVSEAAGLKVGDIDFERRLMVVRGKFDRDRMVPVSAVAMDFLRTYLASRQAQREDWVFPGYHGHLKGGTISERFRDLLRDFGMDKPEISTHSIRHSTATHLLENGASVRHVQELLGHHCIESTVRYTHVMTDRLYQAYRRHHPGEHALYEEPDPDYHKKLEGLQKPG